MRAGHVVAQRLCETQSLFWWVLPPVTSLLASLHFACLYHIAPCSANIWRVHVKVGDAVEAGQTVVVLEAMKMEYAVTAETAGVVRSVIAVQGAAVKQGDPLLSMVLAAGGDGADEVLAA